MSLDLPAHGSTVAQPFAITGWAVDGGASGSAGVDFLDIWAYPNPGSGAAAVYLGQARTGGSRPDIAATFGAQFGGAGYGISVKGLPPAVYQIVAFAHSTITGTFADTKTVTVQVNANPRMSIDAPGNNQTVGQPFLIAGWATDLAAASGTGVDAVQMWAYPNPGSGAPARFVGWGTLGGARPDVAAFLGPNAQQSGYGLMASGLPAGVYDLAVFMHSTVLGTFTHVQVVRVTVR